MCEHTDKIVKNEKIDASLEITEQNMGGTACFEDNRSATIQRRQLQERITKNSQSVGKIKGKRGFGSGTIYWYDWNRSTQKFERLRETVAKETELIVASEVVDNENFAWILVMNGDKGYKSGYVRKKNLEVTTWSTDKKYPTYIDPHKLVSPIGDLMSENHRNYYESNREWYIGLAVLMDAYRSLESKEQEGDKEAIQTRRDLALAALQSFSKVAGIVSPKTRGKELMFKKKTRGFKIPRFKIPRFKIPRFKTSQISLLLENIDIVEEGEADKLKEKKEHTKYRGKQTTAFHDSKGYYRSENSNLYSALNNLMANKIGLKKEEVRVVSDPFVMEVMKREFPLLYQELEKKPDDVTTDIANITDFEIAIKSLCKNIKKGQIPKYDFVFDVSQYYEANKDDSNNSDRLKIKVEEDLATAICYIVEKESNENVVYKNQLIKNLVQKIQLLVLTKEKSTDVLIVLNLNDAIKKNKSFDKVDLNSIIDDIDNILMLTGTKIDPISAKETMLRLATLEEILQDKNIPSVTLATKGKELTGKNNIEAFLYGPQDAGEQIKAVQESKQLSEEEIANKVVRIKETFLKFKNSSNASNFKRFKKLATEKGAPPYVRIYAAATTDLLEGLKGVAQDRGGIDQVFEDKGIAVLLQISYFRMNNAMQSAILHTNNMIRFLSYIEVLHDQLQMILAIVKPHTQDTVFSKAIKKALEEPPQGAPIDKTVSDNQKTTKDSSILVSNQQEINKKIKSSRAKRRRNIFSSFIKPFGALKKRVVETPKREEPITILDDSRPTVPIELTPLVYHEASAMHALTSVFSSVEKQKGTSSLNVLVLQDNYYEAVGGLDYKGAVQHAKAYDISVLNGYKLENEGILEASYENVNDKEKKPEGKLDIYICDFHHNISTTLSEYRTENLINHVNALYKEDQVAKKFTVAIDCTIDYIRSKDVQLFLEANKDRITSGALNVVLYRSAQKFDMLGMDNYYGGYTITINDNKSYNKFNERISQTEDHVSGLAHQGLAHLAHFGSKHLDNYREALMNNTKRLYNILEKAGLNDDTGTFFIAKNSDPNTVFLDIRGAVVSRLYNVLINWAKKYNKTLSDRPSFGFPTSNLITVPGNRVRFTPGLESEETIDEYAYFFIAIKKVFDFINGVWKEEDYEILNYEIDKLKGIPPRRDIKYIEAGVPLPLDTLTSYQQGELSNKLEDEADNKMDVKLDYRQIIKQALSVNNKKILSVYTIKRNGTTFIVEKKLVEKESGKPTGLNEKDSKRSQKTLPDATRDIPEPSFVLAVNNGKQPIPGNKSLFSRLRPNNKENAKRKHKTKPKPPYQKEKTPNIADEIKKYLTEATDKAKVIESKEGSPKGAEPTAEDLELIFNENEGEASSGKKLEYVNKKNWEIMPNKGGGDCLYFALNGDNNKIKANNLRGEIVDFQRKNGMIRKGIMVDNQLSSILNLSKDKGLRNLSKLAASKENISEEAYLRLMTVEGSWGGRSEAMAFSLLREVTVYIIESHGLITEYSKGKSNTNIEKLPDEVFNNESNTVVLYKTSNHWERVVRTKHHGEGSMRLENKTLDNNRDLLTLKNNNPVTVSKLTKGQKNNLLSLLNIDGHQISFQPENDEKKINNALKNDNEILKEYTITKKEGEVFVIIKN